MRFKRNPDEARVGHGLVGEPVAEVEERMAKGRETTHFRHRDPGRKRGWENVGASRRQAGDLPPVGERQRPEFHQHAAQLVQRDDGVGLFEIQEQAPPAENAISSQQFPERTKALTYFQSARDLLLRIRADGGLAADAAPVTLAARLHPVRSGSRDLAADGSSTDPTDEELKAFLRPVPVTPPAETIKSFETSRISDGIGRDRAIGSESRRCRHA